MAGLTTLAAVTAAVVAAWRPPEWCGWRGHTTNWSTPCASFGGSPTGP